MKKLLAVIFILIFACFEFNMLCAYGEQKVKKEQIKHRIEFTTKDKFILVGDLYLTPTNSNKPLVVAAHSFSLNSSAYQDLAQKLRLKGYNVLAMDIRGHGRSVYNEKLKLKSRYKFTDEDWQKLPNDIVESINYVKNNYPHINCEQIIFIGADIGASAQVIGGLTLKKQPVKFIIISPMLNFKGLYIPIKITNYIDTKFFVLLSQSDKILFSMHSKTPPVIKTYPKGGAGNQLLKVNPDAINDIINFIVAK